ncbi:MAG: class I SAM-dependent methyltransferase [Bacteroidetes bacterium]|nr:class I SAM-dependent methyltransferase [Bacteroidota bacterium]
MRQTRDIFLQHKGNLLHKWDHYFEIYDRYFQKYVDKEVVILEVGVSQGGSIDMWQQFFGNNLRYFGIDINPRCKELERENVKIFIGSQSDKVFLESLKIQIPDLDILIDDGGHTMQQQITTFEVLFSKIKEGGIYLCEDNHSSYWFDFGGGMKRKGTYIEYIKNLIDVIHLWHVSTNTLIKNHALKDKIYSIHIYDSIVVIEKKQIYAPFHTRVGIETVGYVENPKRSVVYRLRKFLYNLKDKLRSGLYK